MAFESKKMNRVKIPMLLATILLTIGCTNTRYKFYECYTNSNQSLVSKMQNNFEDQLENKYEKGNYKSNLILYLEQLQKGSNAELIKPPKEYLNELYQSGIVRDIWIGKSINYNSQFIECLQKSEESITIEYLDRLLKIGDMSPSVIGASAIQIIQDNKSIDKELKLIFLVNFYLIWMNG